MAFRSHLARDFSLKHPTHRQLFLIAAIVGVLAVIDWLVSSGPIDVLLAPIHVGVVWALGRELDPDHQWTGLVAGAFAGVWVLYLGASPSIVAVVAVMAGARVMTETTGRRPLLTDLVVVGALGVAAGYTAGGWAAGVGVGVAVFLDDRRSPQRVPAQTWVALGTVIGATVVAWLSSVTIPSNVRGSMSLAAAAAAFLLIVRRPEVPASLTDARHKTPLRQTRLHMSRAVTGIVVYAMTGVLGVGHAAEMVPLLGALGLVIASNEIERVRRRG